jgi:hypothetical protein
MKRTTFIFILSFSFLLVCSCSTPIEEYKAKNDDEKDIIDLLKRYTKIINTGNTEQILTLFHENGVYVTGRGNVPLSREKMSKWKQEDWLSDGLRSLYNPEINIDGNEAAVMVQAKFGNYKTYKIFTLVKENDEWLIMRRE